MSFRALTVLSPHATCERLAKHARTTGRAVRVVEVPLDAGLDPMLAAFHAGLTPDGPRLGDTNALERAIASLGTTHKTALFVVEREPSDESEGRALRKLREVLRAVANDRLHVVLLRASTSDESE